MEESWFQRTQLLFQIEKKALTEEEATLIFHAIKF